MDYGIKVTGGKYHKLRKRKHYETQNQEREATIGSMKRKQLRGRGGIIKTIILKADKANVQTGKRIQVATIINVEKTPQNQFLSRQNRLMKGAIIETSLGKARITNRPSQEGCVNAVLTENK